MFLAQPERNQAFAGQKQKAVSTGSHVVVGLPEKQGNS